MVALIKKSLKKLKYFLLSGLNKIVVRQFYQPKKSTLNCLLRIRSHNSNFMYSFMSLFQTYSQKRRISSKQLLLLISFSSIPLPWLWLPIRWRLLILESILSSFVFRYKVDRLRLTLEDVDEALSRRESKILTSGDSKDFLDALRLALYLGKLDHFMRELTLFLPLNPNLGLEQIWDISYLVFNELAVHGEYEYGEKLLIEAKSYILSKVDESQLIDKGIFFTAIGHQALLALHLELDYMTEKLSYRRLFHDARFTANSLFSSKIRRKCDILGWQVVENHNATKGFTKINDLETIMIGGEPKILRRKMGDIHKSYLKESQVPLIALTTDEKTLAFNELRKHGLPNDKGVRIYGIHIRESGDPHTAGRDSDVSKYTQLIEFLASTGGWIVSIGDESQGKKFSKLDMPNFINFATQKSTTRELIHLFTWSNSHFFIGSNSGGTCPAITFGIPILWTDIFPLRHFRPPGELDLMIPKIVTDNQGIPISFQKVLEPKNSYYDSENLLLMNEKNLRLLNNSSMDLKNGAKDMLDNLSGKIVTGNHKPSAKVSKLYKSLDLNIGASWAPSFLRRWENLL
jgi:putative glycosyltransferase (TIGR04372 family)